MRRSGTLAGLTAVLLALSAGQPRVVAAFGATRTISLYHIHTKETLTVTYKRDGRYDPDAMKKIDWIMRDWRLNEATEMDPKTIDLLWEMHTELGSKQPISIICGFRSEKTNNMLRRTVGGQAKGSFHIKGQAVDATFPDISLKQMRYSALIRERGGVGYYPTSGIPFVHVDSGPVRAWPRLPRQELALLFPSGETQHRPASGGSLSREDARDARARNPELAQQVATYFDLRNRVRTPAEITVAELGGSPVEAPVPQSVMRPAATRVAAADEQPPPQLVASPQLVRDGAPSESDRGELNKLVSLASLTRPESELSSPAPVNRARALAREVPREQPAKAPPPMMRASLDPLAALTAMLPGTSPAQKAHEPARGESEWAPVTQFDDDHPEELSYRPFPIAPLLTESPSADDAALVRLSHPDLARTLDLLEDRPVVLPMRLRPGRQVTEVMWAQQFRGEAVDISMLGRAEPADETPSSLASRSVTTTPR